MKASILYKKRFAMRVNFIKRFARRVNFIKRFARKDGVNRFNRGRGPSPGQWESGSAGHSDISGISSPTEELFVSPLVRSSLSTMLGELSDFDSIRDQQAK